MTLTEKPRRIAWFSPVPPARTGVAAVTADVVPVLRGRGDAIDVYTDALPARGALTALDGVHSAHDFIWRHLQQPYDLVVYQLGNSFHHEYAWAYALAFPGLIVLHDTRLHHARAAQLLRDRRAPDYRSELAFNEPGASRDAAELAIAGFDSSLYYDWPMIRTLVETATLVAVHGEGTGREVIEALQPSSYGDRIVSIRLGHGEPLTPEREQRARRRVRQAYGIDADAVVFGVFGGLTPEKRIPQILKAFGAIAPMVPSARLLLVGAPAAYYDLMADVASAGVQDRVTVTGYVESDAALTDHLAACDVSLNLRWPTARETSGPWLRALAAGRPTIITDLVHLCDAPSLDPRTWTALGLAQDPTRAPRHPVCVSIDILDEDHSLRLAMRRLAKDATLRADLGRAAAEWWRREHSLDAMADDYERVMRQAIERQSGETSTANLPAHLRDDGRGLVRSLLEPFNLQRDTL